MKTKIINFYEHVSLFNKYHKCNLSSRKNLHKSMTMRNSTFTYSFFGSKEVKVLVTTARPSFLQKRH